MQIVDPDTGDVYDDSTGEYVSTGNNGGASQRVVSNTGGAGTSDNSSPWGSILSNVGTLGNTAAKVLTAVNGPKPKPKSSLSSLLPILAIGGAVLVLLLVVVGRR